MLILLLCKRPVYRTCTTITWSFDTQECNLEEVPEEEESPAPAKSSKDKKANGPDVAKAPNLVFKITSRVPYKTVLKGMLSLEAFAISLFVLLF